MPRASRSAGLTSYITSLVLLVLAAACGGSDSTTAPPEEVNEGPPDRTAASIELLTDSVRPMGMLGVTFKAIARGRNAGGEIVSLRPPTWSTDTPDILNVTADGFVTSLSEGAGRAIARMDGVEAVVRVPVREVARLEWQERLGEFFGSDRAPTIGTDGTVYASNGSHLWALDPGGGAVRRSIMNPHGLSGPAIGPDGTFYFGTAPSTATSEEGGLFAMGSDGTELWRLPRPASVRFPLLDSNGTLYAMYQDGNDAVLMAVDAERGELLWEYRATPPTQDPSTFSAPALSSDGVVYFSTTEGTLWAVRPDGASLWATRPGGDFSRVSPVVSADGTIYLGSLNQRFYAVNPQDGSVRWSLDLGYPNYTSPAFGSDGTMYMVTGQNVVLAITPAGSILWTWRMQPIFPTSASPVVGGDGTVYVGALRGLLAISPDGVLKWDFNTELAVNAAPAIGLDGTIYLMSADGLLHAIRELDGGNGGFDASPWPVWRGNRQNTGRAGP